MGARRRIFAILLAAASCSAALAREVPPAAGRVNDTAGMLSPDTRQSLEAVLVAFEQQTRTQLVVLTIDSLEGEALERFAFRVAEAWKVGQKGTDNGVVFLIVKNDRKMRFEVGYGLEGQLPDVICRRILDDVVTPRFRAGDFDTGIKAGVAAVISRLAGRPGPVSGPPTQSSAGSAARPAPDKGGARLRQVVGLLTGGLLAILLLMFAPRSSESEPSSSPDLSGAVLFTSPRPSRPSSSDSSAPTRSYSSSSSFSSGSSRSTGTPFVGGGGRFGGGGASSSW